TRGSTVTDFVTTDPRFSRFVELLQMSGLAETLAGEGPFTVFAPTNEAFARANQNALRAIIADRSRLRSLLMYHVVRGRYDARTLNNRAGSAPNFTEQTLAGPLATAAGQGGYTIGGVTPVAIDLPAANGIIHAVDVLIRPPSENNLRD
ncbi:MAG TPA: fasciclin domain-containing protein, partial [Rhodothermales bacterium]|nr:fasciclin domain-containing protein [Rhodothermales bacterium]